MSTGVAETVVQTDSFVRLPGGLLRLATCGSLDDGKSTWVGRLLYDTKSVLADQAAGIEEVSCRRGQDGPDLALLTDGLRAERKQGNTIDVAHRYFATPGRRFILADTPGHVQYMRNTVTGASTADLAVTLVDARNGVVAQTMRHCAIAALRRGIGAGLPSEPEAWTGAVVRPGVRSGTPTPVNRSAYEVPSLREARTQEHHSEGGAA